jgi:hypothetical protein
MPGSLVDLGVFAQAFTSSIARWATGFASSTVALAACGGPG